MKLRYYNIIPQAKLPRNITTMFTYSSKKKLNPGALVLVEFRKKNVLGLVIHQVKSSLSNRKDKIKSVQKNIAKAPKHFVKLVPWLAKYYLTSPSFIWKIISPEYPLKKITKKIQKNQNLIGKNFKKLNTLSSQIKLIKKNLKNQSKIINSYYLNTASQFILYYKLIAENQAQGKQTLMLVPTINRLKLFLEFLPARWQKNIVLLYSDIYTAKNRYWHCWQKILNNDKNLIIIGTRSAIFAPFGNLGLIIIDSAESDDYKQYDQNPRYDARTIAKKISKLTQAKIKIITDGFCLC